MWRATLSNWWSASVLAVFPENMHQNDIDDAENAMLWWHNNLINLAHLAKTIDALMTDDGEEK